MDYPKFLLKDIYWSFSQPRYVSIEKFEFELKEYNEMITDEEFSVDLDAIVLPVKKVVIQYLLYKKGEPTEPQIPLTAEGDNFTAKELLFKIHQSLQPKLKNEESRYFEGLLFGTKDDLDYPGVPVYFLLQGS